jgi:hypothetical protein
MASPPNWGNSFAAFISAPSTQVRVSKPYRHPFANTTTNIVCFSLALRSYTISAAAPFFRTLCTSVLVVNESAMEHWRNGLRHGYFQPRTREA